MDGDRLKMFVTGSTMLYFLVILVLISRNDSTFVSHTSLTTTCIPMRASATNALFDTFSEPETDYFDIPFVGFARAFLYDRYPTSFPQYRLGTADLIAELKSCDADNDGKVSRDEMSELDLTSGLGCFDSCDLAKFTLRFCDVMNENPTWCQQTAACYSYLLWPINPWKVYPQNVEVESAEF
jgi:hypothetical protein